MPSLVVHLNGGELYDVEPAEERFEAAGSFDVELRNHGQPVHVHLRLDEALSRVSSLAGTNHFVEGESAIRVPLTVADGAPTVTGELTVVTGYGKGTELVEVTVAEAAVEQSEPTAGVAPGSRTHDPAPVDARTTGSTASGSPLASLRERLPDVPRQSIPAIPSVAVPSFDRPSVAGLSRSVVNARGAVALGVLAAIAVGIAAASALVARGVAVVLGIFAVLVALAVAAYLMVQ